MSLAIPVVAKGDVGSWLKALVTPGMRCVDVGAASGEMTRVMLECGAASVLAIEPDDRHRPCEVGQWIRAAVSTRTGMTEIHRGFDPRHTSCFRDAVIHPIDDGFRAVPCYRLDDLVPAADLIKVDVQGSEVDVLAGAPTLLAQHPIWLIEVWPKGLTAAGTDWRALLTRFWDAGYDVFWQGDIEVDEARMTAWAKDAAMRHHCNLLARVA